MMKVENSEGLEIEVYTPEEVAQQIAAKEAELKAAHEAALADKDEHVRKKLEEFQQGKSSQELKDQERDAQIAEAKRLADEANAKVASAEERRLNSLKDIAARKFVGEDPELKARFDESWSFVAIEIKEDADVARKAEMVANMLGLNSTSNNLGNMPMGGGGGFAPKVSAVEKEKKDAEYAKFKSQLGLDEFLPTQS